MGMMGKMKDLYKMQKQAKQIKKELKNIHIEAETEGIIITVNGETEVVSVKIPEHMRDNPKLEVYLVEAFNKGVKKAQAIAAEKMKDVMGDMGFPGLGE